MLYEGWVEELKRIMTKLYNHRYVVAFGGK